MPASLAATTEPAPRRRLPPEVRRAQLLGVAEEVFTRLGYQGCAVEDIASAAGVTRTLVYKYFADKDEIYLECVRAARHELEERFVAAALAQETPQGQLRAGIGAYFTFVRDRDQRWDMLFGGGSAVAGAVAGEVADLRYQTAEQTAALVRAAVPALADEEASAFAHAISGACEQLAKWWRRHPDTTLEVIVDRAMTAIWTGLESVAAAGAPSGSRTRS